MSDILSTKMKLSLISGILCLLLIVLISTITGTGRQKPNFIIILTDDQGYNDLSCFGSDTIKTPHLDL